MIDYCNVICNDSVIEASEDSSDSSQKKKCKRRWGAKSRWGDSDELEKETVLCGLPTVIPSGLTKEQEEQYLSECVTGHLTYVTGVCHVFLCRHLHHCLAAFTGIYFRWKIKLTFFDNINAIISPENGSNSDH